ncbi:hypothetical protein GCM10018952_62930 [Streptosporangium vulgare]
MRERHRGRPGVKVSERYDMGEREADVGGDVTAVQRRLTVPLFGVPPEYGRNGPRSLESAGRTVRPRAGVSAVDDHAQPGAGLRPA